MEKEKHANISYGGGGGGDHSNYKVKLMCSYGGKIHPRPTDHQLAYVGGDTKILTVDRTIRFPNLIAKLHSLCDSNFPFRLKYQLPGEDLDALISVFDDADLENMMFEYDRMHRISTKPARFRLFVFFSADRPATTPDFLFGFDKEYTIAAAATTTTTTPNTEASKNSDTVSPENVDSDPRDGAEIPKPKQIQGNEAQGAGVLPNAYSRDSNVTHGGYFYGAPLFYRVPVPAATGYYQIGPYGGMQRVVGNREQPVYTFVPVFPSPPEQVSPTGGHVSSKQSEGFVGGGGGSMQPTVMMAATSNHESKVSPQA